MKNKTQIYFLGTKEIGYECFKIIIDSQESLNVEIKGVLTNQRSLGLSQNTIESLCTENKIPIIKNLDELLNLPDVDLIVSVQYHQILKPNHINKAKKLAVNFHLAPLPEYRGCNQFSFAIIDQVKEFGTTLHVLEPKIDGGPVLFESRFNIPDNIFVKDLYDLTFTKSIDLFKNHWADLVKGNYKPINQIELAKKRKTGFYLRKEIENLKIINPNWPIEKQKRYFRATFFPPFSPPVLQKEDKLIPLNLEWYNQNS